VRLLLDTHVVLWWLATPEVIAPIASHAIAQTENTVYVSAASIWEMGVKQQLQKLTLPGDPLEAIVSVGFDCLAITAAHSWRAGSLPPHHRDPFDRLLVAQAEMEGMVLVTRDVHISHYGVPILPA